MFIASYFLFPLSLRKSDMALRRSKIPKRRSYINEFITLLAADYTDLFRINPRFQSA